MIKDELSVTLIFQMFVCKRLELECNCSVGHNIIYCASFSFIKINHLLRNVDEILLE